MENEEILKKIEDNLKENKITFMTAEGICETDLDNFTNQPVDGMLYDLNRDDATILTLAQKSKNLRWVNDYALIQVFKKVCEKNRIHDQINKEYDLIKTDYDKLASKHNECVNEYKKLVEDYDGLTADNDELVKKHKDTVDELEQLKDKMDKLIANIDQLTISNTDYKLANEKLNEQLVKQKKELESKSNQDMIMANDVIKAKHPHRMGSSLESDFNVM